MAVDRNDFRSGKHFERAGDGRDSAPEEELRKFSLDEEERDMRAAGRKLAHEEADAVLDGLAELKELMRRQDEAIQMLTEKVDGLDGLLDEFHAVADELHELGTKRDEADHAEAQATLMGVGKVQHEAEEETVRSIKAATTQSKASIQSVASASEEYIKTLTEESKGRIERLARVTVPDRIFHSLAWAALVLVLFILCHIVWSMVTS